MKDVIKNGRHLLLNCLPLLSAVTLSMAAVSEDPSPVPSNPEEEPANWYQIDIILFTPKTRDLDAENWREVETVAYPHDVIAIAQGQEVLPFRLSQLAQMRAESLVAEPPDTALIDMPPDAETSSHDDEEEGLLAESMPPEEVGISDPDDLPAKVATEAFGRLAFEPGLTTSSLADIANSLRKSSHYEIRSHQSWVQPITEQTRSIMMQAGQRFDDAYEFEGALSFKRTRYIHLLPHLWYTRYKKRTRQPLYHMPLEYEPNSNSTVAEQELIEVERRRGLYAPLQTYHMTRARRLRTGEIHYLDHPLFGLIVRVTNYTLPVL